MLGQFKSIHLNDQIALYATYILMPYDSYLWMDNGQIQTKNVHICVYLIFFFNLKNVVQNICSRDILLLSFFCVICIFLCCVILQCFVLSTQAWQRCIVRCLFFAFFSQHSYGRHFGKWLIWLIEQFFFHNKDNNRQKYYYYFFFLESAEKKIEATSTSLAISCISKQNDNDNDSNDNKISVYAIFPYILHMDAIFCLSHWSSCIRNWTRSEMSVYRCCRNHCEWNESKSRVAQEPLFFSSGFYHDKHIHCMYAVIGVLTWLPFFFR